MKTCIHYLALKHYKFRNNARLFKGMPQVIDPDVPMNPFEF